jgi:hypothetical protein
MSTNTFLFPAPYARRVPDPIFHDTHNIERHILFVPVRSVPKGLPLDPNASVPNVRWRIYREVERSLLDIDVEPGTFHLKHRGITVVAKSVDKTSEKDSYKVTLSKGHGILDGGHTYELITSQADEVLPEVQFVKFEVLTNVPNEWIGALAQGLNTSVQAQPMSLDNLAGRFDWIREELEGEPYLDAIAWREDEEGEFDGRDIVSLLTLFNVELFPNADDTQPVIAYEKKSKALELYEQNEDSYRRLRPLLRDVLTLHDTIRCDSGKYWNEVGGKFGKFAFVETRKRGDFTFPFTGKTGKHRLMNGALYPMLGAFRWMIDTDSKFDKPKWRRGFRNVLRRWEASAEELIRMTSLANTELGHNPNAIGKSRNHWANLHARVAMRDLLSRTDSGN